MMKINLLSSTASASAEAFFHWPSPAVAQALVLRQKAGALIDGVRSLPEHLRNQFWAFRAKAVERVRLLGAQAASLPRRSWDWMDSRADHLAGDCDAVVLAAVSPFRRGYRSASVNVENYWASRWVIRRGFLVAIVIFSSVAGSTLWAIMSLPYLPGHPILERDPLPLEQGPNAVVAREAVPAELAWFFIKFPYVSSEAQVRQKNHHTFIIIDAPRKREYVVSLGQTFRRVEIYFSGNKGMSQTRIFTQGKVRMVSFNGDRVTCDVTNPDANQWMWTAPLWNAMHLKIYSMADFWLDSPYKRNSCAGFVHQYLKDAGVATPLLDAWDMAKLPWARVPIDEMEPGDIITIRAASAGHRRFWHHSVTHVGVYLGHGKIIHASTPSLKARRSWVRVTSVDAFRKRIDKVIRPPSLL